VLVMGARVGETVRVRDDGDDDGILGPAMLGTDDGTDVGVTIAVGSIVPLVGSIVPLFWLFSLLMIL